LHQVVTSGRGDARLRKLSEGSNPENLTAFEGRCKALLDQGFEPFSTSESVLPTLPGQEEEVWAFVEKTVWFRKAE
jgi:hypothetical protein